MRRTHKLSGVQAPLKFAGGLKYFENIANGITKCDINFSFILSDVVTKLWSTNEARSGILRMLVKLASVPQ